MIINRNNISQFISALYRERKNETAPPELLQRWQQLSDEQINHQLEGLFQSWGMSYAEKEAAIAQFQKRNLAHQQPKTSTNYPPKNNYANYAPPPPSRKSNNNWIIYLLLIGIILIGSFLGFKYLQYSSLDNVYAITDNISIRDKDGKVVGRMDLYDKDGNASNSFTKLRVVDKEVHYRKYDDSDKEFPTRKILMDSIGFWDFLIKKDEVAMYVNTNYVVNDKREFELYQSAFKEIQNNNRDNEELKALYRKVIVGSMAGSDDMKGKYLLNYTKGLSNALIKQTTPFIIQELKPQQHYVIIAPMSDGFFYRFEGDINKNEFTVPIIVKTINDNNEDPLKGAFRFINSSGKTKLYDVTNKAITDYELIEDVLGKNIAFRLNKPEEPQEETYDTMRIEL